MKLGRGRDELPWKNRCQCLYMENIINIYIYMENIIYLYMGRRDSLDKLFYKPKPDLIKLIGFLKSSNLTHLLNKLGRTRLLVG